jgi:hypothetical protein
LIKQGFNESKSFAGSLVTGIKDAFVDGWTGGLKEIQSGNLNELQVSVTPTYRKYNDKGGSTTTTTPTAPTSPTSPAGRGGGSTGNTTQSVQEDPRVKLEKALQEELTKITIQAEQDRVKQINMEFDKRIADTRAKYAELGDEVQPLIDKIEAERNALLAKYDKEAYDKAVAERQKLIQLQMENAQTVAQAQTKDRDAQLQYFNARLAAIAIQQQMERDQYEGNQAMIAAIDQKYQLQREQAAKDFNATIAQTNAQAVAENMAAIE